MTGDVHQIGILQFPPHQVLGCVFSCKQLHGKPQLAEQSGLRQTTNIVNCPVEEVYIGMPVRVVFEPLADVALPLFEPEH